MAKPTYYEQLKHPNWQKMRLRILERDEFMCRWCFDKDGTLSVHHTYYEKGLSPWEYPAGSLVTLCESCHLEASGLQQITARLTGQVAFKSHAMHRIIGYMTGLAAEMAVRLEPCAGYIEVDGYTQVQGLADFFGITQDEALALRAKTEEDEELPWIFSFDFYALEVAGEKKRAALSFASSPT